MRISTAASHNSAVSAMQRAQTILARTQNQLATGRRVQTPADDPGAAVHIIELERQLAASEQYAVNGTAVKNRLEASELGLADASLLLQRVRELAVQANSGSLNAGDRENINTEIRARSDELMQIANRQDPSGEYLYAGLSTATKPFDRSASGVRYMGDSGSRSVQLSATQNISDGHPGQDVFLRVPEGNGTFVTSTISSNTGSGLIDGGSILDPNAWVPDNYTLRMTAPGSYEVLNGAGTQISSGTFVPGNAIAFRGVSVVVDGAPTTGDQFRIRASGNEGLFATLDRLTSTLNGTTTTSAQRAQYSTQMGSLLAQLSQGIDHLQNMRADVGARLSAIDSAGSQREDQKLQLNSALSDLRDLDYAEAVSRMNQQLVGLQAAQQSYAKISQLSLFNYL